MCLTIKVEPVSISFLKKLRVGFLINNPPLHLYIKNTITRTTQKQYYTTVTVLYNNNVFNEKKLICSIYFLG